MLIVNTQTSTQDNQDDILIDEINLLAAIELKLDAVRSGTLTGHFPALLENKIH